MEMTLVVLVAAIAQNFLDLPHYLDRIENRHCGVHLGSPSLKYVFFGSRRYLQWFFACGIVPYLQDEEAGTARRVLCKFGVARGADSVNCDV